MKRLIAIALVVVGLATAPGGSVRADRPSAGVLELLVESGSPEDLRARLVRHALEIEKSGPDEAGESFYYRGASFEREGQRDSAIASYRRAVELRGSFEDRVALIDALLLRRGSEDVRTALELIHSSRSQTERSFQIAYGGRLAWAHFLAGDVDSANGLFDSLEHHLKRSGLWRFRMGRVLLSAGHLRRSFELLMPLAVDSRWQDVEVKEMLSEIAAGAGLGGKLTELIDGVIDARDRREEEALRHMGGRRMGFTASDGFTLGGAAIAPPGTAPRPAAVVMLAPGDSMATYDSLATTLTDAGLAVILLDVRGSGWSVAPICPLPETWEGRQERLHTLAARDPLAALRALAAVAPLDTSRYVVVGVGRSASIAVEAAEIDPRVHALVLVSPRPEPLDDGPMRRRLADTQVPTFFQTAPEDLEWAEAIDGLFQAGNQRASRLVESRRGGAGPLQFYYDPSTRARLTEWLKTTLSKSSRRAAPPSSRRKG